MVPRRRGRPRKHPLPAPEPAPEPVLEPVSVPEHAVEPEIASESPFEDDFQGIAVAETGLFADEEPSTVLPVAVPLPLVAGEAEETARKELAGLLNKLVPLKERAELLDRLAHKLDTKRAPVALRAIQEINALCGITTQAPTSAPPMFQLPPGTEVSVKVDRPEK